jgi:hypothetical protein
MQSAAPIVGSDAMIVIFNGHREEYDGSQATIEVT